MNASAQPSFQPSDAAPEAEKEPDLFQEDAWDDCYDVTPFDISRARPENNEELLQTKPSDELPTSLTFEEVVTKQKSDFSSQNVLQRQSESKNFAFFENQQYRLLKWKHRLELNCPQIVVPESPRPRLLIFTHSSRIAGHTGQNRMLYTFWRKFYWPHMAEENAAIVRNCHCSARNRLRLQKYLNWLQ